MSRRIMPVLCALMGAVMLGLVMANALMLNAHASDAVSYTHLTLPTNSLV